jgi:hypothetical protein
MHGTFVRDLLKTCALLFRQIAFKADPALNSVDEAFVLFDAFLRNRFREFFFAVDGS